MDAEIAAWFVYKRKNTQILTVASPPPIPTPPCCQMSPPQTNPIPWEIKEAARTREHLVAKMRLDPADFTVRLTHCGYFAFSVEYSDQLLNYTIVGNVEECTDTPKLVEKFWTVTRKNTSPCEHCPYWSVPLWCREPVASATTHKTR